MIDKIIIMIYNKITIMIIKEKNMNDYEKDEINRLPNKYRPLGAWSYFGYQILFMIPLAGLICLIVFSFSDSNINRRSFARSYFCAYAILIVILILVLVIVGASGACSGTGG